MKLRSIFVLLITGTMILAGCATAAAPVAPAPVATQAPITAMPTTASAPVSAPEIDVAQNSDFGSFLVDAKGMTLYLYTKDTPNTSTCYDKCAAAWPPLLTTSNAMAGKGVDDSKFGTTQRTDGTTQVTYNGWPLYYFVKDKAAGDVTGQNVGGVWFVLSPAGDKIAAMAMPAQNANSNANSNSNSNTNSSGDAQSGNVAVSISNFAFAPSPLTVKIGSTVTWTNNDSASHNVTADDGSFKSDTLAKGATFSFTFTKAGTYQYYCSFHGGPGGKGMSGMVTVTQ